MKINQLLKNPQIQQYSLELLFPIIGYFFFGWSLFIIIIFYLIDQLSAEIAFWFRIKYVLKESGNSLSPLIFGIFSFIFLFGIQIYWMHLIFGETVFDCQPYFYKLEWFNFLKNEFWFLFPLILLTHYMKDKMFFYKSELPFLLNPKKALKKQFIQNVIVLSFVILLSSTWSHIRFNEIFLIILIPICKLIFDIFIKKETTQPISTLNNK